LDDISLDDVFSDSTLLTICLFAGSAARLQPIAKHQQTPINNNDQRVRRLMVGWVSIEYRRVKPPDTPTTSERTVA
jgi:hypothetical protein